MQRLSRRWVDVWHSEAVGWLRRLSIENRLAFSGLVIAAVVAVTGIGALVVQFIQGSKSSTTPSPVLVNSGTNNGSISMTVSNGVVATDANPVPACPKPSPTPQSDDELSLQVASRERLEGSCWDVRDTRVTGRSPALVEIRAVYQNVSEVTQDHVVMQLKLPDELRQVPDATFLANSSSGGQYRLLKTDAVATVGIDLGGYRPRGNAFVKVSATTRSAELLRCGSNVFEVQATAQAVGTRRYVDTVEVRVVRDC